MRNGSACQALPSQLCGQVSTRSLQPDPAPSCTPPGLPVVTCFWCTWRWKPFCSSFVFNRGEVFFFFFFKLLLFYFKANQWLANPWGFLRMFFCLAGFLASLFCLFLLYFPAADIFRTEWLPSVNFRVQKPEKKIASSPSGVQLTLTLTKIPSPCWDVGECCKGFGNC